MPLGPVANAAWVTTHHPATDFGDELDAELELACRAVLLVATTMASRVTVANLRHGRAILEPARDFAAEHGSLVSVLATWNPDRIDLVIEPAVTGPQPEVDLAGAPRARRIPARTTRRAITPA